MKQMRFTQRVWLRFTRSGGFFVESNPRKQKGIKKKSYGNQRFYIGIGNKVLQFINSHFSNSSSIFHATSKSYDYQGGSLSAGRGWRAFSFKEFYCDDNKRCCNQNERGRNLSSSNNVPKRRNAHRDILSNLNDKYKNSIAKMSDFVNMPRSNVVAARTIPNQKEAIFAQTFERTLHKEALLFLSGSNFIQAILSEQNFLVNEDVPIRGNNMNFGSWYAKSKDRP